MQNLYIYPVGCAIILVIFGNFWESLSSQLYEPSVVEIIPVTTQPDYNVTEVLIESKLPKAGTIKEDQLNTEGKVSQHLEVSEKMELKRKILERGCSMMHSLFEMSQNGTSYEDLLTWHTRIHDLNYPLASHRAPSEKCYPPLQIPDVNLVFYQVPASGPTGAPTSTALFCLPPKCGTTSYQRALTQHITYLMSKKPCERGACFDRYFMKNMKRNIQNLGGKKDFIAKIGKVKILSDDVDSPAVYWFMNNFKQVRFVNPMTFLERDGKTTPIYPQLRPTIKRILNTRNPFSRLFAAWGDKLRSKYYEDTKDTKKKDKHNALKALKSIIDRAEPSKSPPPDGYTNSFHGFLRYVTQEKDEQHLNRHWKSISFMCQPCRFAYDYIMDIENAKEDSEYVFQELDFDAKLPLFHSSSKSTKKSLEDYYKNIPKALIKKLYAKYFLDFVLLGFSSDQVQSIVNVGTDEASEYSFKTYQGFNSSIFTQSRKVI